MSTRYVWSQYNTALEPASYTTVTTNTGSNTFSYSSSTINYSYSYPATSYNQATSTTSGSVTSLTQSAYFHTGTACYLAVFDASLYSMLRVTGYRNTGIWELTAITTDWQTVDLTWLKVSTEVASYNTIQGSTLYGYSSSSSSSTYPSNSYSGSYWYVYQGSDSIDPKAISYSTDVESGDSLTISLTKSSSNTYGGTITYYYQQSTDGGSTWSTLGSTTTTSYTTTVPSNVESVTYRAYAKDNYGFTSTTYVTGSTITLKVPDVYVCGGGIKTATPVLSVNGTIKTDVTIYKCVDGVIKT